MTNPERGTSVPGRQTLVDHERRSGARRGGGGVRGEFPPVDPARPRSATRGGAARGSAP